MPVQIAVLDDYQQVAAGCADWERLPGAEVTFFVDHVDDLNAVARRLQRFDIIGIMRERTPFPAELLQRLPNLRLLVTTGRHNAAVDVAAATALGIKVCGTPSPGHGTAELAFGLILDLAPRPDRPGRLGTGGGLAGRGWTGSVRGHPRFARAREPGESGSPFRSRLRNGGNRLE